MIKSSDLPKDWSMRCKLARTSTDPEMLEFLAEDAESRVREVALENKHTPTKALSKAMYDAYPSVRLVVAANPNTPIEALVILSKAVDNYISFVASNNLKRKAGSL